MLDIKFIRENPQLVKDNIEKKFQHQKLELVDEVLSLDKRYREAKTRCDQIRGDRNKISKQIGALIGRGEKEEAEKTKINQKDKELQKKLDELSS